MMKRRIMGVPSLVAAILLASGVSLGVAILPGTSFGGSQWQIVEYPPPTSLEPNEVIAYEHANFVGRYIRFKLQPGMRQLLVPGLPEAFNDVISSIQVGANVAVVVFDDANYYILHGTRGGGRHQLPTYTLPVFNSSQNVIPEDLNDKVTSLIVFPKELKQPLGVMLYDNHSTWINTRFFPLAERLDQAEAKYTHLDGMNDDANELKIFPDTSDSPAFGKVNATSYENPNFGGRSVTLPGADGAMPSGAVFKMGDYQFNDTASSLIVRWIGLPPLQVQAVTIGPPSTSGRVSAPSVPDTGRTPAPPGSETQKTPSDKKLPIPLPSAVAATGISGKWNSNIGAVYEMQQSGNQFTWSAPTLNQSGTGTISQDDITLSGPGWTVKGKITEKDASGNPTRIVGENGVVLFRTASASPSPTSGVVNLSGQWQSTVGLVYNITQQGNQFEWTVANSNEKGQGTITGSDVSVSWKGLLGSGSSSGKITVDSSGKATEIKWKNGVRFFR